MRVLVPGYGVLDLGYERISAKMILGTTIGARVYQIMGYDAFVE